MTQSGARRKWSKHGTRLSFPGTENRQPRVHARSPQTIYQQTKSGDFFFPVFISFISWWRDWYNMNLSQAIPPDAPPSAVREYLAQYLAEKYNVPIKVAGDLVSPWKIGWGNELSYYDLETFRSLFGSEIGAILYHHVNCTRSRCASSHNCTTEEKKPGQFQSEPMSESMHWTTS